MNVNSKCILRCYQHIIFVFIYNNGFGGFFAEFISSRLKFHNHNVNKQKVHFDIDMLYVKQMYRLRDCEI